MGQPEKNSKKTSKKSSRRKGSGSKSPKGERGYDSPKRSSAFERYDSLRSRAIYSEAESENECFEKNPPTELQERCRKFYDKTVVEGLTSSEEVEEYSERRSTPEKVSKRKKHRRNETENRTQVVRFNPYLDTSSSTPKKKKKPSNEHRTEVQPPGEIVRQLEKLGVDALTATQAVYGTASSCQNQFIPDTPILKKLRYKQPESDTEREEESDAATESEDETESPKPAEFKTLSRKPSFVSLPLGKAVTSFKISNPFHPDKKTYNSHDIKVALSVVHQQMQAAPADDTFVNFSMGKEIMEDMLIYHWDKNATEKELEERYPRIHNSAPKGHNIRAKLKGIMKNMNGSISRSLCMEPFGNSPGEIARVTMDLVTFSMQTPERVIEALNKAFAANGSKRKISYRMYA